MNPIQMLQMLNQNPQQLVKQILGNNPMAGNLINLIGNKDSSGIEQMARNLAKEKGLDADKMYNDFKSRLGM